MADMMVGHGPAPDFGPYVPDFIVVKDGERRRVVSRDGDLSVPEERLQVTPCTPEPRMDGCWPLVFREDDISLPLRVEWFPLAEEEGWRPARAKSLLESAKALHGRPELALRTVRAASALVLIDIERVAGELSAKAFSGESLVEAYERQKR